MDSNMNIMSIDFPDIIREINKNMYSSIRDLKFLEIDVLQMMGINSSIYIKKIRNDVDDPIDINMSIDFVMN